ncbi:GH25 family lysozyme [Kitasatospora sp. NPDC127116]|uniref:GH25 family lysozyme n=1 Tax=Kitasatospora sp. NPDC127116 TaxID=3345367 RepID=UPI00362B21AF
MATARGYDVSDYQSSIPADADFVFIKASEGARTEQFGYAAKRDNARRRGLVVGHYHFLHAENPVAGEVEHFCRVVGQVPAGELLVLDFEPYGQPVADAQATAAKNAWLAAVKQRYPNNRVGLYTSVDWWHRTDDNAGDFLWIADYVAAGSPRVQAPWKFHQWTDAPLDADVYNGSIDDLRSWAGTVVAASSSAPAAGPGSWPGLQLVSRDQWGARPWREPNGSILYAGARAGVKVHYLGEQYTFGDHTTCPAYVRRIQASHMDGNGWSDIGYSFMVCEHGYVFEGRGLDRRNSANGDTSLNEAHYAVCALLGSSGSTEPATEQLQGLRDAIEYCQQRGPAGPEVKGHRDGHQTDCPGDPLYGWVQTGAPRPLEDDMTPAELLDYPMPEYARLPNGYLPRVGEVWNDTKDASVKLAALSTQITTLGAQLAAQGAAITALAQQIASGTQVDADALVAKIQQAIDNVTVHLTTMKEAS